MYSCFQLIKAFYLRVLTVKTHTVYPGKKLRGRGFNYIRETLYRERKKVLTQSSDVMAITAIAKVTVIITQKNRNFLVNWFKCG